jgi:hypothetical protein
MHGAGRGTGHFRERRALTRNRPRVSYLSRHSFGIRTGEYWLNGATSEIGCPDRGSTGRLCRTGSRRQLGLRWVCGRGIEVQSQVACGNRAFLPAQEPGPSVSSGQDQAKAIPGDKFFAGCRLKAGCACARTGSGRFAAGASKGRVWRRVSHCWRVCPPERVEAVCRCFCLYC